MCRVYHKTGVCNGGNSQVDATWVRFCTWLTHDMLARAREILVLALVGPMWCQAAQVKLRSWFWQALSIP